MKIPEKEGLRWQKNMKGSLDNEVKHILRNYGKWCFKTREIAKRLMHK
jgi:hypothetical protein